MPLEPSWRAEAACQMDGSMHARRAKCRDIQTILDRRNGLLHPVDALGHSRVMAAGTRHPVAGQRFDVTPLWLNFAHCCGAYAVLPSPCCCCRRTGWSWSSWSEIPIW